MPNLIYRTALAMVCLLIAELACAPAIQNIVLTTQVDSPGRPLNSSTVFSVDTPRILCSVSTAGLPASAAVQARWLYNDGVSWNTIREEAFPAASAAYIVFAVNAPAAGWQQGSYAIRLLLDGKESAEKGFAIKIDENAALPLINNFSATPGTVTPGQPLTLSWNVTSASRVAIEPDVGSVGAGGSMLLSPRADTTYTLTALNSGGIASSSINVKVLPPVTESADLAVADIFREASMVYYTVRNNGTAASRPSSANLYVGMNIVASGYIPPVAPGEQKTLVFGTFNWSYAYTTPATVCIDTQNENGPSNALNKCRTRALAGVRVL
jgi:hypothetical protein